jgi:hypothetical protein
LLDDIQTNLFNRAKAYRDAMTTRVDTLGRVRGSARTKRGFVYAHWDGTTETELEIKERTKATIRCIPVDAPEERHLCPDRQTQQPAGAVRPGLLSGILRYRMEMFRDDVYSSSLCVSS